MIPVTGEKEIAIGKEILVLRFTWRAIGEIEAKHGDNPNLFDPAVVADVAAAGLRDRHPEYTAEKIMDLSPPLIPLARDVQEALTWAYFGIEPIPEAVEQKKSLKRAGLFTRLSRLLRLA